jgi:glycosyltransferase involved in cell wall biosynthesis
MKRDKCLKIAMIGSKGLPSVFGGIEKHVKEISIRLAARGHEVTVFGRAPFCQSGVYEGVRVRKIPSIPTKNLDTASNSLLASIAAFFGHYDVVHFHGIGPSIFCWIPAFSRTVTVSTIHALDYRQSKWGKAARYLLRLGERRAVQRTDASIAVSKLMAGYLTEYYGKKVVYIPNGATPDDRPEFREASSLGIESGKYVLSVGRLIADRGFDILIEAWKRIDSGMKLVIAGDARFEMDYASRLSMMADDTIVMPGYITGAKLEQLYAHCSFYILPSMIEGLPISLIEAMSYSRPVLVSDIPENLEVAEGIAEVFKCGDVDDLHRALEKMIRAGHDEKELMGRKGRVRVEQDYNWDDISNKLEALYSDLMS